MRIVPPTLIRIVTCLTMNFLALCRGGSFVEAKTFKVLHIMSYDSSWVWNQEQLRGFKEPLKDVEVEYKVFEMDTKRNNSKEWIEKVSQEAKELIDAWKPDLVYTNDDNAQEYVAKYYVNTPTPFVFSAVNSAPEVYGFAGSQNVTGILEEEHFVQTMQLLKKIVPNAKKIAAIADDSAMWVPVFDRMKAKKGQFPDVEFISWDVILTFKEFQEKVLAYQTQVDALALVGIFTFKDEHGKNVPFQTVLKWVVENSKLPDFAFWEDRVLNGNLCGVAISGYEQGLAAGKIAKEILVNGKKPSDFPIQPTIKGKPFVSLARAQKLGIKIPSDILLATEVVKTFAWEQAK